MEESLQKNSLVIARLACLFSMAISVTTKSGWLLDIPRLTYLLEALPAMQPNTSFGILLGGISILVRTFSFKKSYFYLIHFMDILILLLGLLTIVQYYGGSQFGIDQLLIKNLTSIYHYPGRPAPQTALNFALLGAILLFYSLNEKTLFISQLFAMMIAGNAILAITGYLFTTKEFLGFPNIEIAIGMAVHTAIGFILLAVAFLINSGNRGLMTLVFSQTQSGWMARRLLAACVLAPPFLGVITRIGFIRSWYEVDQHVAIFTVLLISIFIITAWKTVRKSEQKEIKVNKLLEDVREAHVALMMTVVGEHLDLWPGPTADMK